MVHTQNMGRTEVRGCLKRWCLGTDMRATSQYVMLPGNSKLVRDVR